mmetsp:Transcript_40650/g.115867  ORF Transcript_40650/g.115867 Transcript_40650/m.115867 type:complete len:209 (-) Transcript_40650:687-1313(-)
MATLHLWPRPPSPEVEPLPEGWSAGDHRGGVRLGDAIELARLDGLLLAKGVGLALVVPGLIAAIGDEQHALDLFAAKQTPWPAAAVVSGCGVRGSLLQRPHDHLTGTTSTHAPMAARQEDNLPPPLEAHYALTGGIVGVARRVHRFQGSTRTHTHIDVTLIRPGKIRRQGAWKAGRPRAHPRPLADCPLPVAVSELEVAGRAGHELHL